MARFISASWQCMCGEIGNEQPWDCPAGCGKEVCESCFSEFMHCRDCSNAQPDKTALAKAADAMYGTNFSDHNPREVINESEAGDE